MVTGTDIFKEFLALAKTITVNATVTAAAIDDVSTLPQVVVNYPLFPRKRYTYGTSRYNRDGSIDITILANKSETAKAIVEAVQDKMFSSYKASTSVHDLDVTISDFFREDIGGKSVHSVILTFGFKFRD